MNELGLFAGAGGGLLASKWLLGWRTVCYVEKDPYCAKVLKARITDGWLDDAPIWDDVTTFDGRPWRGVVDIVSGGFPCQPYSSAGKRLSENDPRNLWPSTVRVIRDVRPEWVFLENVSRLLSYDYFGVLLGDLAESGFSCAWDCIPASAVGANHQRDRLWIVAHADHQQRKGGPSAKRRKAAEIIPPDANCWRSHAEQESEPEREGSADPGRDGAPQSVADADGRRSVRSGTVGSHAPHARIELSSDGRGWWEVEPDVGRVVDGVAARLDRLKAIGNGQVPPVAAVAWRLLRDRLMETSP